MMVDRFIDVSSNGCYTVFQASMMVTDIKMGFRELLGAASWMDNVTYEKALRKLDTMIDVVGYPEIIVKNTSAIDQEYRTVSFLQEHFYQ